MPCGQLKILHQRIRIRKYIGIDPLQGICMHMAGIGQSFHLIGAVNVTLVDLRDGSNISADGKLLGNVLQLVNGRNRPFFRLQHQT